MVEPGELRRKVLRGTEALYRVIEVGDEIVVVEVVEAPGLDAGETFRFTLAAVAAMERVEG